MRLTQLGSRRPSQSGTRHGPRMSSITQRGPDWRGAPDLRSDLFDVELGSVWGVETGAMVRHGCVCAATPAWKTVNLDRGEARRRRDLLEAGSGAVGGVETAYEGPRRLPHATPPPAPPATTARVAPVVSQPTAMETADSASPSSPPLSAAAAASACVAAAAEASSTATESPASVSSSSEQPSHSHSRPLRHDGQYSAAHVTRPKLQRAASPA